MLELRIKVKDDEQKKDIGDKIHNSLVGSSAYLSNEILLNYTSESLPKDEILLVISDGNENNMKLTMELRED